MDEKTIRESAENLGRKYGNEALNVCREQIEVHYKGNKEAVEYFKKVYAEIEKRIYK